MTAYTVNKRLPYMQFNWSEHSARVGRLSYAERGLFDAIRAELWSVEGVGMDRDSLKLQLEMKASELRMLDKLIGRRLLEEEGGLLRDPIQRFEWDRAVGASLVNRANGKLGGRPPKVAAKSEVLPNGDNKTASDF